MRSNVPQDSVLRRNREDRKFKKAFKEIKSRKTDTEALSSRVHDAENDITASQSDITALQNGIAALTASDSDFDNSNNSTGTSFASVQEAIDYILNNFS